MNDKSIESILREQRVFPPSDEFAAAAQLKPEDVEALYAEAAADHEAFWARLAREEIHWETPFSEVLDASNAPNYRWFTDGRLNVSFNCLDIHLAERGDKTAIRFEGEGGDQRQLTYRELTDEVSQFANALKARGIVSGDRVVIYMPMVPEAVIAMQACARIGAIHSVVFGGFSAGSLGDRIVDAGAKMLITADGGHRGGRVIELKAAADEALANGCQTIETVIVLKRADCPVSMQDGRDIWWSDAVDGHDAVCEPVAVDA